MNVYYREYQGNKICMDWKIYSEVMFHVFSNAVKYSPAEGNLIVEIRYVNSLLITAVTDSGYGISSQVRRLIFKTF